MRIVFVRNPYNYDVEAASDESGINCQEYVTEDGEIVKTPSLTKQSFAEEVDINTIVRRFGLTGQLPENVRAPTYADFEEVVDYQTALNAVLAAQSAFMELPANVRERFGNDPQKFVEFTSDDNNKDEARRLGLLMPGDEPVVKPPAAALGGVATPPLTTP